MTPVLDDPWLTVYGGDVRDVLPTLPAESVHCVVTSPPYWGLRDYGTPGQLGLEPTPEEYVSNMVAVFREVRRVLRSDGTVWLNLGDSYATSAAGNRTPSGISQATPKREGRLGEYNSVTRDWTALGLKQKDLVGIPWRVAFALQADGWYLRSDVIWSKPNPMPESVTDRPTKSHEYLFLLSKAPRYYYDADAVREPLISTPEQYLRAGKSVRENHAYGEVAGRPLGEASFATVPNGRNLRSVWTIATAPYPGAHFATFPPKLVEPCIKASTSERGVCPECGAPWTRVVERTPMLIPERVRADRVGVEATSRVNDGERRRAMNGQEWAKTARSLTTGWRPSCAHDAEPVPATVLDIFAGSGTVGMVAQSLSRRAVLIDLNPDYLRQCLERNAAMPLGLGA